MNSDKKINLSGITVENITGIFILLLALINSTLQMFGINTLPITNDEISSIVSTVFLIITALWNTWKNRNITKASQTSQQITDLIKNGEVLASDIERIINNIKTDGKLDVEE